MSSRPRSSSWLVLLVVGAGCAKSTTAPDPVDAAVDSPAFVPVCGDHIVEQPEQCDDGNTVNDDVCANDCTFNPICGDGVKAATEECDDGNNRSGDGCSGRCLLEACGNLRLDPGEACDGSPGCRPDCSGVITCGDGMVQTDEQCDDGNTTSWDGCSAACELERAVVISQVDLLSRGPCDMNGDGYGDSALGVAFGFVWPQVRSYAETQLTTSPFNVLVLQGVDDPSFAMDDPDVRVAWVRGDDANGTALDFNGTGTVRVTASSLVGGAPLLSFSGSITSSAVTAGPEDVSLPFVGGSQLGLRRARIYKTPLVVAGTAPDTTVSIAQAMGTLCGAVPVGPFFALPSPIGSLSLPGVPTNSCDPATVPDAQISLGDLLVGGVAYGALDVIAPTQPDVDMDGDGFESYVVTSGTNCQAVIVGCIDGDGTSIPGRACTTDPRMRDAVSAAFAFTAPTTTLVP